MKLLFGQFVFVITKQNKKVSVLFFSNNRDFQWYHVALCRFRTPPPPAPPPIINSLRYPLFGVYTTHYSVNMFLRTYAILEMRNGGGREVGGGVEVVKLAPKLTMTTPSDGATPPFNKPGRETTWNRNVKSTHLFPRWKLSTPGLDVDRREKKNM